MSTRSDYVRKQWRWTRRFATLFPFFIAAIFGFNIWQGAAEGKPFDWQQLWAASGMIAFGGVVYLFCGLIFRIVLAKVTPDERRQ